MNEQAAARYRELLKLIQLRNIVASQANYARQVSCRKIVTQDSKEVGVFRASFQPEYEFTDNSLLVPVGHKLEVKANDEVFASFEFIYEVEFSTEKPELVEVHLTDKDVREFFLGYQMEKFVWSYLRCAFSEACSRLGILRVTLPMKL